MDSETAKAVRDALGLAEALLMEAGDTCKPSLNFTRAALATLPPESATILQIKLPEAIPCQFSKTPTDASGLFDSTG